MFQDVAENVKFPNGIQVSSAMSQGNIRPQMEDKMDIVDFIIRNQHFYVFCVYDGHCGTLKNPEISAVGHIQKNFTNYLRQQLLENNIRVAIERTFLLLDHDLKSEDSGTTVSMLLIVDDEKSSRQVDDEKSSRQLWVANVGDSSIFGFNSNPERSQKLSRDHKPCLASEMKQMQIKSKSNNSNFKVDDDGYVVNRHGDSLAMSRSLGDSGFQDVITSKPTITQVQQSYDYICLASDGIWDVMSGKQVWELIKNQKNFKNSAKIILQYRNKTYEQHDNCALILVRL